MERKDFVWAYGLRVFSHLAPSAGIKRGDRTLLLLEG